MTKTTVQQGLKNNQGYTFVSFGGRVVVASYNKTLFFPIRAAARII
jgi:hypothetical protein